MSSSDELEMDNKDIQTSEKKSREDYLIHEAILFLIDVSLPYKLDQKENVSNIAKIALVAAYEMLLQKVISNPMISFGILLYGTKDTNILEFPLYPNLYLIMHLNTQSGPSIRNFKILLSGSQDYKNAVTSSILKLHDSGIVIEPFFITGEKDFNFNKFYKDVFYSSENTNKIKDHLTYEIFTTDQMLDSILKRQYPKRFLFECPLEIAPDLSIDVRGYMLFKKKKPVKTQNIYIKSENPKIVKTTANYICKETSAVLENKDIKMAYDFGGEKVLFSKEQMDMLHFYEDPIIRILGFKRSDQLHFWENILPSYFLYPIDNKNPNSSKVFASLAYTLYKLDKIAVTWFYPYRNSNPRICVLISNFKISEKQEKSEYEFPQGLFAITLPFSDDIRQNPKQTSLKVHIKIGAIKGNISAVFNNLYYLRKDDNNLENFFSNFFVTVQLYANNKALTLPNRTCYKNFDNKKTWNEWLTFPLNYSDLPLNAQFAIVVSDEYGFRLNKPFASTTVKLFSPNKILKTGLQKLNLHIGVFADGNNNSTTPSDLFFENEIDRLETLIKKYESGNMPKVDWLDNLAFDQIEKIYQKRFEDCKSLVLYVDFPQFDFPILFSEYQYPSTFTFSSSRDLLASRIIVTPPDPELLKDNPVEAKYRCLSRSHRNGLLDRELKPNANIRDQLNIIMAFPPTQKLSSEEKDLIWKFRYYLTRERKALVKFLKAVVWTDVIEVKQVYDLLALWTEIDIDDALELLGPEFRDNVVRCYAVNRLKKADDSDLMLYLLQLVQALRFEDSMSEMSKTDDHSSSLAHFLIERAVKNEILGINFYWYLTVECEDKIGGKLFFEIAYQFTVSLIEVPNGLIRRNTLKRQAELLASILFISKEIRSTKESRPKKIERLRYYLSDANNCLIKFEPLPLPLDPTIFVTGIIAAESTVFKSSLLPLLISFKTTTGSSYSIIFKSGDDLRQDQLVIQIVSLMDKLLRNENLDLKLTPYKILATGMDHGIVQFIQSISLMSCLTEYHGSILAYFRSNNPDNSSELGVKAEVMDTYTKSCAGYCVITYLLGVGDRHLDNLLLCPDGRFFHADFGFILGRDPKPFSPAMKLCKEMVEGMGGASSPYYSQFKLYCYTAFITLRKSANLIMNLFALMVQSNISDIKIEPEKAVLKERFCLEMSDEEAIKYFQQLINDSVSALFPILIDRVHNIAQYWRS
ncbi:hypothetical protein PCANB_002822 [Pneumocystis canis]|nr:hypothetical protein PCANB_002822 [Pneumocystis canis]